MKSMLKKMSMGLVAGAFTALPLVSHAEEAEAASVSASLDVPVLSAYVWRGQVLNDEAVAQPTFTISKGGFALNWWGSFNLTDNATGDEAEFSEHDITVSYSTTCPLTGAGVTVGIVNYDFPNVGLADAEGNLSLVNDTREAFVIYSLGDVLLSPTLSVYYDFKEADGFYGSLGISHGIALTDALELGLSASIGGATSDWGDFYYGEAEGLTDASVGASLPIALSDTLTLTPGVTYTVLLEDAEDAVDASGDSLYFGETDYVVGSVKLSVAF
jgi:hypothetical protein